METQRYRTVGRGIKTALCALAAALAFANAAAFARQEAETGERLDPALYGPGVIETMDEVMARERVLQAEAAAQKHRNVRGDEQGSWVVPSMRSTYFPKSGTKYVMNKWGDTRMGIGFPDAVTVRGAYFAGQGAGPGVWAPRLRAAGFRLGKLVSISPWLEGIGAEPKWLEMNFVGVDRIVIEAEAAFEGAGYYAMDDLTYEVAAGRADARVIVLDFEDTQFNEKLTGTAYKGLFWEEGHGDFHSDKGIHAPITVPSSDPPVEDVPGDDGARGTILPPELALSFQGVIRGDASQFSFPPDTCGAVGTTQYVVAVNTTIAVYNKTTGVRTFLSSLGAFQPGSNGDPRVLFDQHSNRWIIMNTDFSSRIYLAVSTSDNAQGGWFKTSFVVSQGSDTGCWPDYPTLGVDAAGIYVSANMIGCNTLSIFAIDKAPLIAPSPSLGTVTAFRSLPFDNAIQPVHTYGNPGGEYFISRSGSTSLRIRKLTGPLTNPTLTQVGTATILAHNFPPDVPVQGSTVPLDSVDYRLMNAVYRNGSIWTAHTIGISGRAACRWYQVTEGSWVVAQYGTVFDSVRHYFFPSIAVDAAGNAALGCSGAHAGEFAGCYYTGRRAGDPLGQMAEPQLLRAGSAAQNNIDGAGRNRWGDYSLTCADPVDDSLWTIQEYAHATNTWGTRVGKLTFTIVDCNLNGIADSIDILNGTSEDCNLNAIPDECDISSSFSEDCDRNDVPDECQTTYAYQYDDSTTETTVGRVGGGDLLEINTFPVQAGQETIAGVSLIWGVGLAPGTQVKAVIYDDPNNDGDPHDAVAIASVVFPSDSSTAGTLQTVALSSPVNVGAAGDWFHVGLLIPHVNGSQPGAVDLDNHVPNRSWLMAGPLNAINEDDIGANALALVTLESTGRIGNWQLRVLSPTDEDCNANSIPDSCDIADGTSLDSNSNGIPDECEPPPACPGDLDGDNDTDSVDLNILLTDFGCAGAGCIGDLDGDNDTDSTDLNILLTDFGCI